MFQGVFCDASEFIAILFNVLYSFFKGLLAEVQLVGNVDFDPLHAVGA